MAVCAQRETRIAAQKQKGSIVAKNLIVDSRSAADIDKQVSRILRDLDYPEPPLDMRLVFELLKLDKQYYSGTDPSLIDTVMSRMKVAGRQIVLRPGLLVEAIQRLEIKALYLPDKKRVLIDSNQPQLKHRWSEAHEVTHSILPWHEGTMFGDTAMTLNPSCHAQIESEANFGAGRLLFLQDQFESQVMDYDPCIDSIKRLGKQFGNTTTSTLWRSVETWGKNLPFVGVISEHPHPRHQTETFDPSKPCKHLIQSPAFAAQFSNVNEVELFEQLANYCRPLKGGPLGSGEVLLRDVNGDIHLFLFESFYNRYQTLTLGRYLSKQKTVVAAA